jgi:hypothetical protein
VASAEPAGRARGWPWWVAVVGAAGFLGLGLWAMVDPESFFDQIATFEPYNQHFVQDIGAFNIGLGAVLLLALLPDRPDALAVALVGTGIGAGAHVVSHLVGHDLGGRPESDIPLFTATAVLLLAAGLVQWRRAATSDPTIRTRSAPRR